MSTLVFDASSIISIVLQNLIDGLENIKKNHKFYIPHKVKVEIVDNALNTKKFQLEGMLISKKIEEGLFEVKPEIDYRELDKLVNSIFQSKQGNMKIIHAGELEALVLVNKINADALVIDERTTRLLIEDPIKLHHLMERKLHTKISINRTNLKKFQNMFKNLKIIRSTEMMVVAYEQGLLKDHFPTKTTKEERITALLWGLKLNGCSLSNPDLDNLVKLTKG
jgi:hypothetical protein